MATTLLGSSAAYQTKPVPAPVTILPSAPVTRFMGAPIYETQPMTYTTTTSTPPVSYTLASPRPLPGMTRGMSTSASAAPVSYPRLQASSSVPPLSTSVSSIDQRDGMFAPIEFKFVKDDEYGAPRETPLPPMREQYQFTESAEMQLADSLDAKVAASEQRVRDLAAQPLSTQNLENRIQELLDGQQALRYELNQVKLQVNNNTSELEALRRERDMQPRHLGSVAPPALMQSLPVPAMQTTQRSTVAPSETAQPSESRVMENLGVVSGPNFGSAKDYFAAASTHASNLQQSVLSSVARWRNQPAGQ
eukprot:gb/GFBE01000226.1/.p1 GENE.gb/GFBE01000226.1/~~gb/GFBE01000226.1/.p1  ORF type:complete len:306 (+),score=45.59 gb/GFBE01000226.1/:1-918(+)